MAFTSAYIPYNRDKYFYFYATGDGAVGNMDETLDLAAPFELMNIQLHFSGVCSADIYFRVTKDAALGLAYDVRVYSYALSNSTDHVWYLSFPFVCQYGDKLQMSCITDNTWAVVATGWKITG